MGQKSDAPPITVREVIDGLRRVDPDLPCVGGWEGNPLRMDVSDGMVTFTDHTNPDYADGWPAEETCWNGPYQPGTSNPHHAEVRCAQHGHVLATCQPHPHGNCVNPNPRHVTEMDCPVSCPDHEHTLEEMGLEICGLCQGDACEDGCGRGGRSRCEQSNSGPDSHRVCNRCKGSGVQRASSDG